MNRIHTAILVLSLVGIALTGSAVAGIVDSRDIAFITAAGSAEATVGGNSETWASAGVVSRADLDFLTRDVGVTDASPVMASAPAVGVVDGADYRLIAGDGTPGATCDIALVAAINPRC